jgi:hypothetical protein
MGLGGGVSLEGTGYLQRGSDLSYSRYHHAGVQTIRSGNSGCLCETSQCFSVHCYKAGRAGEPYLAPCLLLDSDSTVLPTAKVFVSLHLQQKPGQASSLLFEG